MEAKVQRLQLVREIQELDRRLGLAIAETQGRSKTIRQGDYNFPLGTLILAIAGALGWMYLDQIPGIPPQFHKPLEYLLLAVAGVSALVFVYGLLRFIMHKLTSKKGDILPKEESSEARDLRQLRDSKRRELQELDERIARGGV